MSSKKVFVIVLFLSRTPKSLAWDWDAKALLTRDESAKDRGERGEVCQSC
jgi:hypothetical protein